MNTIKRELKENWKFHLGECEDAWYRGYDDSGWRKIMIPHDWAVEAPFSKTYSSGTGYLPGGIGWYRLRFSIPEEYRGKRVRLVFDGVYKNSQVWCNSYYLGKRPNGYIEFSYDVSDFVNFGELDNEVSVKVTHTDIADSRWYTGSGITRMVYLIIEEAVHPTEYGCFFQTKEVENKTAKIEVSHSIVNTTSELVDLSVNTIWYDADNQVAAAVEKKCLLQPDSMFEMTMEAQIENPRLWSTEQPNLYRMETWYQCGEGKAYLVHTDKVGIRTFTFDANKGFFLNGVETKFKGVCLHHDGGCLGAAMTAEVWQRRLALLKECGCNAIRCSHNPHMPQLYDLCDAMGFLMMDEAFDEWENPKNKWSTGHNVYPPKHQGYYEDFHQWHEADLKAMVLRDRNHPSIVMWSIGNEIDYPNDPYCHPMFETMTGNNDANKPAAERQYDVNKPNTERLVVVAKHLADIVRRVDTTRPVTLAAAFPELSAQLGFLDALDVAGYNYKEHLYEDSHQKFPNLPFLGSENGHTYQAWRAVADNDYISGQFLWTGIDYLGEAYGWPIHGSAAGIITTCGLPKPEFYRRKAFWTEEPMIQLATQAVVLGEKQITDRKQWNRMSMSWNYQTGEEIIVKCYAPLIEKACVVLSLNGKEIGRQTEYQEDGAFVFRVFYEPGILESKYCREDNSIIAECQLYTTGKPAVLSWKLWQEDDCITGSSWKEASNAVGYIYQIPVTLKDEEGRNVVWNDREVKIQVTGAGELLGIDNGNLADVTPFTSHSRMTHGGRLVAYVRRTEPGNIGVMLTTDLTQRDALRGRRRYEIQIEGKAE